MKTQTSVADIPPVSRRAVLWKSPWNLEDLTWHRLRCLLWNWKASILRVIHAGWQSHVRKQCRWHGHYRWCYCCSERPWSLMKLGLIASLRGSVAHLALMGSKCEWSEEIRRLGLCHLSGLLHVFAAVSSVRNDILKSLCMLYWIGCNLPSSTNMTMKLTKNTREVTDN